MHLRTYTTIHLYKDNFFNYPKINQKSSKKCLNDTNSKRNNFVNIDQGKPHAKNLLITQTIFSTSSIVIVGPIGRLNSSSANRSVIGRLR